jgi:hypothetical protein
LSDRDAELACSTCRRILQSSDDLVAPLSMGDHEPHDHAARLCDRQRWSLPAFEPAETIVSAIEKFLPGVGYRRDMP